MYKVKFFIAGVSCHNCINTIENQLLANEHISNISFGDITHQRVSVSADIDDNMPESIRELIEEMGYDFYEDIDLAAAALQHQSNVRRHWIFGGFGVFLGIAELLLTLFAGPLSLAVMISVGVVSVLTTLTLSSEFVWKAKNQIQRREPAMDTLFVMSTSVVLMVSIASFFVPWLPMMFDVGLLVFGFRHLGLALKETLFEKSGIKQSLQSNAMRFLIKEQGGQHILTEVSQLNPGDIIWITAGNQMIPVDGEYIGAKEHTPRLFKTHINGDTRSSKLKPEENIRAGMILESGQLDMRMRVTATADNSYLASIDRFIEQAAHTKSSIQTDAEYFLQYYFIPIVILVACLSALLLSIFSSPAVAITCAISVLVSACPCNLGIITPLAIYVGMKKAQGVMFQHADALEKASKVRDVIFDLNGTLTQGAAEVMPDPIITLENYCNLLYAMEMGSTHPIGQAIFRYSQSNKTADLTCNVDYEPDGVKADFQGANYIIGNANMMVKYGIPFESPSLDNTDCAIYLAEINTRKNYGYMLVRDPLREHSIQTVAALKNNGITVHLCTGADQATAHAYAQILGINSENVCAKSIVSGPNQVTDKLGYLKQLIDDQNKRALYVGDALNDCDPMSFVRESGGVGMILQHNHVAQNAASAFFQNADVLIDAESLLAIPSFLEVSQQTMSNIYLNLIANLTYNVIITLLCAGILVPLGVVLHPAMGVIIMSVVFVLMLISVLAFQQQELTWVKSTNQRERNPLSIFDSSRFFNSDSYPSIQSHLASNHDDNLSRQGLN